MMPYSVTELCAIATDGIAQTAPSSRPAAIGIFIVIFRITN